ncbi:MAG TPA: NAD(P)-dependent oxidoreductase [Chitinophagaceae bacterium]|nr:NAD(P)-dependent oxidoreductase [Chitinophagaceae bacterium]
MILLTGASGFIGHWLLKRLSSEYGKDNIVLLTSKPMPGYKYLLHRQYQFPETYFIDEGFSEIEAIVHFGAFIPKSNDSANSINLCNQNINSTTKLLSASLPNLKKILFASTVDIYDSSQLISESTTINPVSLYGASKVYCEKLVQLVAAERNCIWQILRLGHVYGPGEESYKKLIPITIQKILMNETINIYGTGDEVRSYIYIDDLVENVVSALKLNFSAGPINIVGEYQVTVKELINMIIKILGKGNLKIEIGQKHGRDLKFDNSKMQKLLVREFTSLEDGLRSEVLYFSQR